MRADPATSMQPPPPAPPPPGVPGVPVPTTVQGVPSEAAARVAEELDRARQAVAEIAPSQNAAGPIGVITLPDGRIRITPREGQPIEIDRSLFRQDQIQDLVETALQPPEPPQMPDRGPPESVIALIGILAFFLTLMVIGFPLARAGARRMDRKAAGARVPDDLAPRLERIEQAVEAVAVEVERVSEAQRFSARLLSERLPEVLPQLDAAAAAQRARLQG